MIVWEKIQQGHMIFPDFKLTYHIIFGKRGTVAVNQREVRTLTKSTLEKLLPASSQPEAPEQSPYTSRGKQLLYFLLVPWIARDNS